LPDGEPSVRAAGLTFLPCAAKEFPAGSLKERLRWLSKLQGEEALRAMLQNAADRTEAMLNSLPATLAAAAVDAVVLDTVLFYTELVPISLGIPYAHVANALHFDYSGYTPLRFPISLENISHSRFFWFWQCTTTLARKISPAPFKKPFNRKQLRPRRLSSSCNPHTEGCAKNSHFAPYSYIGGPKSTGQAVSRGRYSHK
jgi:hypothetical protein